MPPVVKPVRRLRWAEEESMTDPKDMSCREQADYLRMEIINRFIKPMLDAGIDNLFVGRSGWQSVSVREGPGYAPCHDLKGLRRLANSSLRPEGHHPLASRRPTISTTIYCDRKFSAVDPSARLGERSPALPSRGFPTTLRINISTAGDIDVK
jgi:hypothetical protein